ncbi:MAG: manganese efflux pump [Clostridia bacterium]|nr:manganese efflux pump [Clostridia bacterium]
MGFLGYILTGFSVSMDTLAVGLAKGMAMKKMQKTAPFIIGVFFGLGQAVMLCAGYFSAGIVSGFLTAVSHWIAFGLLALVGANMIREAFEDDDDDDDRVDGKMDIKSLLVLTLAMSMDSLAVGVSFAFIKGVNIWLAMLAAAAVTFLITAASVFAGHKFGDRFGKKAGMIGVIILILLGVKVLLEYFGILG